MSKNYTFVSKGDEDWASVMIKDGKYKGIIYQYGQVSVAKSEDENGNMPLSFKYNIIDHSGHNQEDLESSLHSSL